jgi:hypothetical protein
VRTRLLLPVADEVVEAGQLQGAYCIQPTVHSMLAYGGLHTCTVWKKVVPRLAKQRSAR